jgi:hypothetical protein
MPRDAHDDMTELVRIALRGQAPAPEFRRRAGEQFERALDVHLVVR